MNMLGNVNFDHHQERGDESVNESKFDANSFYELQELLRERLMKIKRKEEKDSLRKIGLEINVSHTHLAGFRDGKNVNMHILNRLAHYFGYRYRIENYEELPKNA